MNKFPLVFTALLAATPIALLLPGCSGGGLPGNIFPTPTPKPAVTPSPAVSQTSNFTLGNGQRAILKTTIRGTAITGTMQILAPLGQIRTLAGLTRTIKIGTFSITGTFTPQRGFSITVRDGNTTLFTMSGLFPTATEAGTYTLTYGNDTDSGTIPSAASPTPTVTATATATATARPTTTATATATARPTVTPAPGISRVQNIVITPGAGFNGSGTPAGLKLSLSGQTPGFSNASVFGAPSNQLGGDTNLVFEGPNLNRPARVGDTFNLQNQSAFVGIIYYAEAVASGPERGWESTSGTMRVTAVSDKSVSFTLTNVVFAPRSFGTTSATGTFTLNGDGVFNGS